MGFLSSASKAILNLNYYPSNGQRTSSSSSPSSAASSKASQEDQFLDNFKIDNIELQPEVPLPPIEDFELSNILKNNLLFELNELIKSLIITSKNYRLDLSNLINKILNYQNDVVFANLEKVDSSIQIDYKRIKLLNLKIKKNKNNLLKTSSKGTVKLTDDLEAITKLVGQSSDIIMSILDNLKALEDKVLTYDKEKLSDKESVNRFKYPLLTKLIAQNNTDDGDDTNVKDDDQENQENTTENSTGKFRGSHNTQDFNILEDDAEELSDIKLGAALKEDWLLGNENKDNNAAEQQQVEDGESKQDKDENHTQAELVSCTPGVKPSLSLKSDNPDSDPMMNPFINNQDDFDTFSGSHGDQNVNDRIQKFKENLFFSNNSKASLQKSKIIDGPSSNFQLDTESTSRSDYTSVKFPKGVKLEALKFAENESVTDKSIRDDISNDVKNSIIPNEKDLQSTMKLDFGEIAPNVSHKDIDSIHQSAEKQEETVEDNNVNQNIAENLSAQQQQDEKLLSPKEQADEIENLLDLRNIQKQNKMNEQHIKSENIFSADENDEFQNIRENNQPVPTANNENDEKPFQNSLIKSVGATSLSFPKNIYPNAMVPPSTPNSLNKLFFFNNLTNLPSSAASNKTNPSASFILPSFAQSLATTSATDGAIRSNDAETSSSSVGTVSYHGIVPINANSTATITTDQEARSVVATPFLTHDHQKDADEALHTIKTRDEKERQKSIASNATASRGSILNMIMREAMDNGNENNENPVEGEELSDRMKSLSSQNPLSRKALTGTLLYRIPSKASHTTSTTTLENQDHVDTGIASGNDDEELL